VGPETLSRLVREEAVGAGGRKSQSRRQFDGKDLSTPRLEEVECLSQVTFFRERKHVSMREMLATVDHATSLLDEFQHSQIKYQHARPARRLFLAGIVGFGCDIGHRELARFRGKSARASAW
jgi:hypothetical protein